MGYIIGIISVAVAGCGAWCLAMCTAGSPKSEEERRLEDEEQAKYLKMWRDKNGD